MVYRSPVESSHYLLLPTTPAAVPPQHQTHQPHIPPLQPYTHAVLWIVVQVGARFDFCMVVLRCVDHHGGAMQGRFQAVQGCMLLMQWPREKRGDRVFLGTLIGGVYAPGCLYAAEYVCNNFTQHTPIHTSAHLLTPTTIQTITHTYR